MGLIGVVVVVVREQGGNSGGGGDPRRCTILVADTSGTPLLVVDDDDDDDDDDAILGTVCGNTNGARNQPCPMVTYSRVAVSVILVVADVAIVGVLPSSVMFGRTVWFGCAALVVGRCGLLLLFSINMNRSDAIRPIANFGNSSTHAKGSHPIQAIVVSGNINSIPNLGSID